MDNILVEKERKVENLIYSVRGNEVMLDSDLAELYNYKSGTRALNQAVKRNLERFPKSFYFQITMKEYNEILKSQSVTSSYGGVRKSPYVFTEQGVATLATILKTDVAAKISIEIMNAFVEMRKIVIDQSCIGRLNRVETEIIEHDINIKTIDTKIEILFNKFKKQNNKIFFKGQIYDAYSIIIDIFNLAHQEIIVIDNYLSKELLDILTKTKKKVIVITNKYNNIEIKKYKEQYNNLDLIISNSFHDRFIIVDRKSLYHCGASFKDLGKKCFGINKIEDEDYLNQLIKHCNF